MSFGTGGKYTAICIAIVQRWIELSAGNKKYNHMEELKQLEKFRNYK